MGKIKALLRSVFRYRLISVFFIISFKTVSSFRNSILSVSRILICFSATIESSDRFIPYFLSRV